MFCEEFEIQKNGLTKTEERKVDEWIAANPDSPLIGWANKTAAWFNKLRKVAKLESPTNED